MRHGDGAQATHCPEHNHGEDRQRESGPPVLQPEGGEHADHKEQVADNLHHELGEEVGQGSHVAVHPFDQFAWCARLVEAKIQAQQMQGQVGAQGVGRCPGHPFAEVGGRQRERLLDDGDADVQQRDTGEKGKRSAGFGGIQEGAQDLRIDQL